MKNLGKICSRVVLGEFASFKPRPTVPKSQFVLVLRTKFSGQSLSLSFAWL